MSSICLREGAKSRSSKPRLVRISAALTLLGVLAGCSDIYYDRRETISFGGPDAVATNNAVQMVDPWPAAAKNRNIPGNGLNVQTAIARYRTGQIIQPRGNVTSNAAPAPPPDTPPPPVTAPVAKAP